MQRSGGGGHVLGSRAPRVKPECRVRRGRQRLPRAGLPCRDPRSLIIVHSRRKRSTVLGIKRPAVLQRRAPRLPSSRRSLSREGAPSRTLPHPPAPCTLHAPSLSAPGGPSSGGQGWSVAARVQVGGGERDESVGVWGRGVRRLLGREASDGISDSPSVLKRMGFPRLLLILSTEHL